MKRILSSIVVAILLTLPVSAFCVSLGNYVELNNATEISNVTELRNVQDLGGLESETIAFIARVIADGGTVEDTNFLNSFIVDAKNNNYFSDIVAAYSPSWGVKGTTTASDLYSVMGVSTDLVNAIAAEQPIISVADLNGKTRLTHDGVDDRLRAIFALSIPVTVVFMGTQQITWTLNDFIMDSHNTEVLRFYQPGVTPNVRMRSGANGPTLTTQFPVGSDHHVALEYNGASSAATVDEGTPVTNNCGTNTDAGGVVLGSNSLATSGNFKYGGVVVFPSILSASKLAAIYNFSKSAYGTP